MDKKLVFFSLYYPLLSRLDVEATNICLHGDDLDMVEPDGSIIETGVGALNDFFS